MFGIYVINMDAAVDRWRLMREQLDAFGLPYERFAAVNGRALDESHPDFSALSYKLLHGRRFIPGEVGCYLSHIGALRQFLDSNADHALILEDDVIINAAAPDVIRAAIDAGTWDLLRLSTVSGGRKFAYRRLSDRHKLAICLTREKGSGAYVVSRKGAEWLVRMLPIRVAYDIAFDLEYLFGMRAAFVTPLVCDQVTEMPTQVQHGIHERKLPAWRYLTVFPFRAFLELTRISLRGPRLIALKLTNRWGVPRALRPAG